jgi:hypothetical protein
MQTAEGRRLGRQNSAPGISSGPKCKTSANRSSRTFLGQDDWFEEAPEWVAAIGAGRHQHELSSFSTFLGTRIRT